MPELPFEKEARNIFAKKDFGQHRPYFYFQKIFLKHLLFWMSSQTLIMWIFSPVQILPLSITQRSFWDLNNVTLVVEDTNTDCAHWCSVWYITCWFVLVWSYVQQCVLTGEKCFVAAWVIIESPWAIREWTSQFRGKEMERWLLSGFEYIGKGKPTRQLSEWH